MVLPGLKYHRSNFPHSPHCGLQCKFVAEDGLGCHPSQWHQGTICLHCVLAAAQEPANFEVCTTEVEKERNKVTIQLVIETCWELPVTICLVYYNELLPCKIFMEQNFYDFMVDLERRFPEFVMHVYFHETTPLCLQFQSCSSSCKV